MHEIGAEEKLMEIIIEKEGIAGFDAAAFRLRRRAEARVFAIVMVLRHAMDDLGATK